jgi:formylglycine-generating enzyme required for sulfatase activity
MGDGRRAEKLAADKTRVTGDHHDEDAVAVVKKAEALFATTGASGFRDRHTRIDPLRDGLLTQLGLGGHEDAKASEAFGRAPAVPIEGVAFPDYEIVAEIGRGGMGIVYRARQLELRRDVAIKKIAVDHPGVREKFLAESRVTGMLDHPGIVPVYQLLTSETGEPALAMKLVRGSSWKEILHPTDGSDPPGVDFHLEVLMSVSNAVAFAHSHGITHNDLKPENVMVGEFGEVTLVDWGMSLDVNDTPSAEVFAPHKSTLHTPSGTPAYWAPELAKGRGKDIGPWTDVYLLGAILCEIATGHPPHRGKSLYSSIRAAMESVVPVFPPEMPTGLFAICVKAMAPKPEGRYQSVAELQQALRTFRNHRESLIITDGARATLDLSTSASREMDRAGDQAARIQLYAGIAEAGAGFRQALVLWPDNAEAKAGEREASLGLARLALQNGDVGLAEVEAARFDAGDADGDAIREKVAHAKQERERAGAMARRTRKALVAAAFVIVGGLSAGLLAIRTSSREAEESARLATNRLADIRRLSAQVELKQLTDTAEQLWPAHPDKAEAMAGWLARAKTLLGGLEVKRANLAALRAKAAARGDRPTFESREDQWEHDTLAALIAGLETLGSRTVPEVEKRLALARGLRRATIDDHRAAWDRAIASIADPRAAPKYEGLRIEPQLGLVPLGPDPASGLWEFAHFASGEVPARDADGKLAVTENTGVVLVLIPGGTFSMGVMPPDAEHPLGSPNVDPEARSAERPVRTVRLDPFFLAKHEFTQGQWVRVAGVNPSAYPPGTTIGGRRHTLQHPVEQVSWKESNEIFRKLGLSFATEAQWEYAARAGSSTVYATGADKSTLQGAVNLADKYCKDNGGPGSWAFETWLDDGYVVHAPVGTFRPNAFGLHEMFGNVWEFVEDKYGGYALPVREGTGERIVADDAPRVFRGGGFRSSAVHARSGDRYSLYAPDFRGFDIGVRAARRLDR